MIRIMCVIPNPLDATSFYRGTWPLGRLQCENSNQIQLSFVPDHNFGNDVMSDVLFMQRPSTGNHVAIAELHQRTGHPIWIDYDDDLFVVPEDNPTFAQYANPEVQKNIVKLACMADIISVTTEALADRFREIAKMSKREFDIRVIPNAVDEKLIDTVWKPDTKERNKIVFWRGSKTHEKDLMTVGYQMVEIIKKRKDWTFTFMGYRPWFITQQCPKNTVVSEGLDILVYHEFLQTMKFPLMIVPLTDSLFNRAKSNIAWLEGSCAGSMVLAPDFQEWKKPGVLNYKTPEDFGKKLNEMLDGKHDFERNLSHSRLHIWNNYRLSKANELRLQLIHDLAGISKYQTKSAPPWTDRAERVQHDSGNSERVLDSNARGGGADKKLPGGRLTAVAESSVHGDGEEQEDVETATPFQADSVGQPAAVNAAMETGRGAGDSSDLSV